MVQIYGNQNSIYSFTFIYTFQTVTDVQVVMLFQRNTVQNKKDVGLKVYLGREGLGKYEGESV